VSDSTETKVCPVCAETIKVAAKLCPFCQSRQSQFARCRQELGPVIVGLGCLGLLAALCAWILPDEPTDRERNFARHRHELGVIRTVWEYSTNDGTTGRRSEQFAEGSAFPAKNSVTNKVDSQQSGPESPGRRRKKPNLWMTGYVTNKGNRAWRVHELEVRLLDQSGKVMDVCYASPEPSFVVQPHHEHAFRVGLENTNAPIASEVRVHISSEGNRPPDD
jgi:hypothetical protein